LRGNLFQHVHLSVHRSALQAGVDAEVPHKFDMDWLNVQYLRNRDATILYS